MRANLLLAVLASLFIFSCSKESETLEPEALSGYVPAQAGKYITYRLDSTVFPNFGATIATRYYQEKHQVDALTTDNLGRPAYRVFRFLRDSGGTTAWQPSGSYYLLPSANTVEVVENNLRFLKLAAPLKEGNTWKGNRFLPTDTYGAFYEFSNDDAMADWEYLYTNTNTAVTLRGKTYNSTLTVTQVNESTNAPVTNTGAYGFINYSEEKYARNLGLIYQEYIMWEYQPPSSGRPGYRGFGIKRTIIDNN